MKTFRLLSFFLLVFIGSASLCAQEANDSLAERKEGVLIINAPQELDGLLKLFIQENKNSNKQKGFRVQIYNGSKKGADDYRGDFIRKYPNIKAYVHYDAPEYRVQVGDFREEINAYSMAFEIQSQFRSAFVVQSDINSPSWEEAGRE